MHTCIYKYIQLYMYIYVKIHVHSTLAFRKQNEKKGYITHPTVSQLDKQMHNYSKGYLDAQP